MSLFREIAYEQGKMVVIATHDPVIYEQADVIYRIEEKKINVVKGADLLDCDTEDEALKKENGAD
jgi:ABC-type lipoprotein export system ATPase subunit